MKDNMKKISSFILVMVFMITMIGCNSNKGVDEKQIINDIQQSEYLQKSNMTIEDIQIEKRKTDIQNKSDTMIAWINTKRDTMESKMCFNLTYTLYNDGWLIETITHYQDGDWKFVPLKGVSQENADTKIKEYSKNITSSKCIEHEEDLESGTSYFTYELKEKYPYATKSKTVKVNYEFNVTYDDGLYTETWKDTVDTVDSKEDWNINGTWKSSFTKEITYSPSFKINSTIIINNYDGITVDCSYDVKINYWEDYHFKGNGTFTVEEIPLEIRNFQTVKSAKGFYIDTKKNADGSNAHLDTSLRIISFSIDENKGVIFGNPWGIGQENFVAMTKN